MRVLMFSWEYPPRVVGGLSRHVQELGRAMAAEHEVHVIALGDRESDESDRGVHVHRVDVPGPRCEDFLQWSSQLTVGMLSAGARLAYETGPFDVVHAHDWTSAFAGVGMKHAYRIPLIATIHATEFGRNSGLHTPMQRRISDIEWYLGYEAWRVIVCSRHMRTELMNVFGIPGDKIEVIPNCVVPGQFAEGDVPGSSLGIDPGDEVIAFVGRLVYEKGVQVLLEAMPQVLAARPNAKLFVIGTGPYGDELRRLVDQRRLGHAVRMLGFVSDQQRNAVPAGRAAVVPSPTSPSASPRWRPWPQGPCGGVGRRRIAGDHHARTQRSPGAGRRSGAAGAALVSVLADEALRCNLTGRSA